MSDTYAEERERLIEGDPIVVVDELLELRRQVGRLKNKLLNVERLAGDFETTSHTIQGGVRGINPVAGAWMDASRAIRRTLDLVD